MLSKVFDVRHWTIPVLFAPRERFAERAPQLRTKNNNTTITSGGSVSKVPEKPPLTHPFFFFFLEEPPVSPLFCEAALAWLTALHALDALLMLDMLSVDSWRLIRCSWTEPTTKWRRCSKQVDSYMLWSGLHGTSRQKDQRRRSPHSMSSVAGREEHDHSPLPLENMGCPRRTQAGDCNADTVDPKWADVSPASALCFLKASMVARNSFNSESCKSPAQKNEGYQMTR